MKFDSIEEKVIYDRLLAAVTENAAQMKILNQTKVVTTIAEIPTGWRFFKPVNIFLKKIVRKMTFWLVEPVFQQQSKFNNAVVEILEDLVKAKSKQAETTDEPTDETTAEPDNKGSGEQ